MASYVRPNPSRSNAVLIVRSIDGKSQLLDLLFLVDFVQEQDGELRSSGLNLPDVGNSFVSGSIAAYDSIQTLQRGHLGERLFPLVFADPMRKRLFQQITGLGEGFNKARRTVSVVLR